jgi:hypothetical protein
MDCSSFSNSSVNVRFRAWGPGGGIVVTGSLFGLVWLDSFSGGRDVLRRVLCKQLSSYEVFCTIFGSNLSVTTI